MLNFVILILRNTVLLALQISHHGRNGWFVYYWHKALKGTEHGTRPNKYLSYSTLQTHGTNREKTAVCNVILITTYIA